MDNTKSFSVVECAPSRSAPAPIPLSVSVWRLSPSLSPSLSSVFRPCLLSSVFCPLLWKLWGPPNCWELFNFCNPGLGPNRTEPETETWLKLRVRQEQRRRLSPSQRHPCQRPPPPPHTHTLALILQCFWVENWNSNSHSWSLVSGPWFSGLTGSASDSLHFSKPPPPILFLFLPFFMDFLGHFTIILELSIVRQRVR